MTAQINPLSIVFLLQATLLAGALTFRWIKVKNLRYSQLEGREELFERGSLLPLKQKQL